MKIKVYVVDLELSPRVKKLAARLVALSIFIFGAVTAVYAAVPKTWNQNDVLTAADLNGNFTALSNAIPKVTEWAAYTPTVATSAGTVTATSKGMWRRVGDSIEANIYSSFTACTGTASGQFRWSLPQGVMPDAAKLPYVYAHVGTALLNTGGSVTTMSVATSDASSADPAVGGTVALEWQNCPALTGGAGDVRITFTFPVKTWTFNGP